MAIKDLSLKALREQINAATREVSFKTDDGATTQMVYIPKFRIPTGLWQSGAFPAQDMELGGFFVDKYQCSHKAATHASRGCADGITVAADDTTNIPVSLPGKVAWTDITHPNAKQACANRKINGVACHLVTMKEWATIAFLTKFLGHDIRGNNSWGRDYRDTNVHENTGMVDSILAAYNASYNQAISRILTGTGPVAFSHNGLANGVFDIVGNVWEWLDFLINAGVYTHSKKARINDSDGITASDTTITIDGMEAGETWPASGLIKIESEYIRYATINYQGSGKAVLSNCTRAQSASAAATHANDVIVEQLTDYCIIPGGATAYIANTSGINATDTTITVTGVLNGPGNNGFAAGDVLQCETEQMTVTAVVSDVLTVARGANGSTAAAHATGIAFAKISPQMSNASPSSTSVDGANQAGYLTTLRAEQDLAALALPATAATQTEEWKDGFFLRNNGQRAALRGGSWTHASYARSGFALNLHYPPSDRNSNVGFRAAMSLNNL